MTAAEHRSEAERLLAEYARLGASDGLLEAQVHATLATIPDPPEPWQVPS